MDSQIRCTWPLFTVSLTGFVQIGWYYFFSPHVQRNIAYGEGRRNRLDLYIPEKPNKQKPAVAFVTGGAWIIGYKAWGSLLAQELVERDVIVACIDYRNFPQTGVSGMVEDIAKGISFFCQNIHKLYLAGQSAGAHLAACALIEQAKKEASEEIPTLAWRASQFKAFLGISGGYNLPALSHHFHTRGFYRSFFLRVMEGEESLQKYSPELGVRSPDFQNAAHMLPATILFHGRADYSIPFLASVDFADALRFVHVQVTTKLYPEKTHTDLFLQDPMRGGQNQLVADILAVVHANDREAQEKDAAAPPRRRMVPECLLQLARKVSPF
ncbi:hypothetical protein O6H91_07G054400 [Diphasiastrum complanatum]|uniref:Uncharacterized protein n=2 Tax=Diphasiastrum complanatum TaxID=34168 RepID=A0ACC2D6A3_DIPCM|nr:hypothetical protein O6H91_07G054400 [Diphasiastrum complanatum]